MEMNPKIAAQQTNLMLGGEVWEPSSTNKSTYVWHDAGAACAAAKEQADALRSTYYKAHFELGADATEYTSAAAEAYAKRPAKPAHRSAHDRAVRTEANFYLGLEKAEMKSMASSDFDHKHVDVRQTRATAAALKKDLRSSHFEFGADAPTTQSSAAAAFSAPQPSHSERLGTQREIKVNTTLLRAQNFDTPTHTFYAETSGKQPDPRDYEGFYTGNRDERDRLKGVLRKTNFSLGASELDYRTEAMMMQGQQKKVLHQPFKVTVRSRKK